MGGCLFHSHQIQLVSGEEKLSLFKRTSDTGSIRKFCSDCGAALFNEHPDIELTDIMAVSIPDLEFNPKLHTNYAEKIVSFNDGLPKYRDFDPAVGGSGETMPD